MKITNCYIERTFNLGSYESLKVGFEANICEGDIPLEVTAELERMAFQHYENSMQKKNTGQHSAAPPQPVVTQQNAPTTTPATPANTAPPLIWEPQKPTIKGPWDKCVQIMNPALQEIINHLTDHTFYSDDGFTYWLLTDQNDKTKVNGVGRRAK